MPTKPRLTEVIDEHEACLTACLEAARVKSGLCLFYATLEGEDYFIPIFSGNEGLYQGSAISGRAYRYDPKEVQQAARMAHAKSCGHTLH